MPNFWEQILKEIQENQSLQNAKIRGRTTTAPAPKSHKLDSKKRYLQIAFNGDLYSALRIIPTLPKDERIIIEAGTPFIKKNGQRGIRAIYNVWHRKVVADIKTVDGALGEVGLSYEAGACAATVIGGAPIETIDLFIERCKTLGMISMIDTVGTDDPLKVIMKLKKPPDVVVLHKGRDEEETRGKVIKYKHINRIKSKYNVLISAAGGVDLKEARSAIFNGANIVVVNVVSPGDPWTGISENEDVAKTAKKFLETIK